MRGLELRIEGSNPSTLTMFERTSLRDRLTVGRRPLKPVDFGSNPNLAALGIRLKVGRLFLKQLIVVRIHNSQRVGRPTDRTTVFETVNEGAIPSRLTMVSCETRSFICSSKVERCTVNARILVRVQANEPGEDTGSSPVVHRKMYVV